MKKTSYIFPILFSILILISCGRESTDNLIEQSPVINPPEIVVKGSVIGQVINLEDQAVSNATVKLNGQTITTNENGNFYFDNIDLFEDGTQVNVEKEGYFLGSRTFNAIANETNQLSIILIAKNITKELTTALGGLFEFENSSINFPSGSYIQSNGDLYNGSINVSTKYLNPTHQDFHYLVPGELKGYTLDGNILSLQSLGVVAVEIKNEFGEAIQLPENKTALIKFPIPEAYVDFAPESIPLWYYDVSNGLWIEDGSATLIQSHYEANISHFSYWACHLPYQSIELKGSVLLNGEMFPNTNIKISDSEMFSAASRTTLDGEFIFSVPQESALKIEIFHECLISSQSLSIQTQSNDQTLSPITIKPGEDNILIEGNIVTCNNDPIQNGFLRLDLVDRQYLIRANDFGGFSHSFNTCQLEEATVYAIDSENKLTSPAFVFPFNSNVNISDIVACGNFDHGFNVNYTNMNWATELEEVAEHSWTISSIQAAVQKTLINPMIYNPNNSEVYMTGAFVFEENTNSADYILDFKSQGFSISGTCALTKNNLGSYSSFKFTGTTNSISVTDDSIFPGGIDEVTIDLVYYN